ncbi:alpha/beta hydrolase family protein [Falsiroseomonas sp. HW251]|uniref:alpha/beta hydrolase family protein n=1 Tax=Falsiroseomonas sp. HW251 TaxID=3390998 RepID=UPI003D3140EE
MTRRVMLGALGAASLPAAAAPLRDTWRDAARGRDIPVLLRLPAAAGPRPVVIVSHGLGGSREGLGYLGEAFAQAGWIAVHLQHPGSDDSVWRGAGAGMAGLAAAALDVTQAAARLLDGIFAVEEVLRRTARAGDALAGRVDGARLAVAGHSYGAWTVQHLVGQRIPGGDRGIPLPERRLKAGIALSPLPPRGLPPRLAFSRVATPMLHVTGTLDSSFVDGTTPADREIPFRSIEGVAQALVVFDGATHAAFAGEPAAGARWADETFHARTAGIAVLFLRAILEGDAAARTTLRAGAAGLVAPGDRVEIKAI